MSSRPGLLQPSNLTGCGQEIVMRIFRINPSLKTMPINHQLLLSQWQALPGGHTQLPLHQILAGNHFSYRMFHLQAGIHLHKIEGTILIKQKFHRASADVIHCLRRF